MKKVEEKVLTLSKDAAMILCYNEEEYKEKVRLAVTQTEKEEAREQGLKEGKKEGIKEMALNMINEGIDKKLVAKVTGLSEIEIDDIIKTTK